ncbi:MAG: HlyC/CorC family transporter [Verrucomicrobiaceae bacterium]|nr:HlyC/CorC family transporter [Verrucomicrobiaceae bacterium]
MTELLLILLLLVFNGVFAMAEIAIVSAKKARMMDRAEKGSHGARLALKLAENPERFLSTVQIGITLVGVLAGAFGGASLAGYVTPWLEQVPFLAGHEEQVAFGLVVAFITYLSLIIGELVPKSLALRNAEGIACVMAGPMNWLSRVGSPLVWVLELSTRTLMRFFGKPQAPSGPTTAEVEVLLREGLITGNVRHEESELVEGVFDLRELKAEEIMRPKPKVIFLHVNDAAASAAEELGDGVRQVVFPVYGETRDHVEGMVSLRALFLSVAAGKTQMVRELMREPVFVSDNQPALTLLEELRTASHHAAMVTDEFGIVRGMVTIEDLAEEIVGDLASNRPSTSMTPQVRENGPQSWLADGMTEIDAVNAVIPGFEAVANAEDDAFQTLAGFIMQHLERLPREGEKFTVGGYEIEIIDMDRQRIDKVGVRRLIEATALATEP